MKKLIFMFIAFTAMTFAACGNKTAASAAMCDSDSVCNCDSVDTVLVDSTAADSTSIAK